MTKKKKGQVRGPKPEVIKLEGDWKELVKKALGKERPEGDWPTPKKAKKGRKKK